MSYNLKGRFGYVSKCRGIPKYPGEFTVNLEKPDNVSDEDLQKWDESIGQFLKKIESDFDL
ncbi:hypothetical protein [Methanobrevibacter thaueri]|jgi:hypothetical protein|uniref:Uncharacterized protein n=1 Tax=Methanobrevibacter thaueri TaxID=190975 RepID=A0A315XNT3_9EURY|nr:hypothetical protein [Methanobrevibacter thaueri]PWB87534.1 hypothetical protein MBBTH_08010 [Methanobrevibacter thaueri]